MAHTRITLATPAMLHLFEHFLQAMAALSGEYLPTPHGPESLNALQLGLSGRQKLPVSPFSLQGRAAPSGCCGVWSSSSLHTLLFFPLPPRILTGQTENPVTLNVNFEHMKRQPRMLAQAPAPSLSALGKPGI